jgi:hypothetical protein
MHHWHVYKARINRNIKIIIVICTIA